MNLHTQRRTLYFARAGKSRDASFKADAELSPEGEDYAQKLAGRLLEFRREEEERDLAQGDKPRPLIVPLLATPFLETLTFEDLDINPYPHQSYRNRLPPHNNPPRSPRTWPT
jgi:hypothetical protein